MSRFSRFGLVCLGYLAAVSVAVVVSLAFWFIPAVLLDGGLFLAMARDAPTILAMGAMVTFPTALPGFLIVLFIAAASAWERWPPFALAGAANSLLAHGLFAIFMGSAPTLELVLACLVGGFAGGYAYWLVAERLILQKMARLT